MNRNVGEYIPPKNNFPITRVDFQSTAEHNLETKLVEVQDLQLYQNRDSFLILLKMIENSKKYFFMNVLSFDCDSTTEPLVAALISKVKQGTDVRLITNKYFSYLTSSCLDRLGKGGVQISKSRTHASYFLSDQNELLIGSQSVARMFFLADGFNHLDRDMMAYMRGPITIDGLKDFASTWLEEEGGGDDLLKLIKEQTNTSQNYAQNSGKDYCRFTSERPTTGVKDIQETLKKMSSVSEETIILSGVRVEVPTHPIAKILKEKSRNKVSVSYIGNGDTSGNGELTMVLDEWIRSLKQSALSFLAGPLASLRNWDVRRVAEENKNLYLGLKGDSEIKIFTYPQFIHYKVWAFDYPAFFIGSANLDETKFGKVTDAGVFCLSGNGYKSLRQNLDRDIKNSEQAGSK